jgi:hypothetical protein
MWKRRSRDQGREGTGRQWQRRGGRPGRLGQEPDVEYVQDAGAQLLFVHRRLDDGDAYFITNRANQAVTTETRFNVRGKAPEYWHADSGRSEPASYRSEGKRTMVPLALGAQESVFVVFRRPAESSTATVAAPRWSRAAVLDRGWQIGFDGLAAPGPIVDGSLGSLADSIDPQVKYFSGTTVYRNRFTLPGRARPGTPLKLDLGQVGDVAEVFVNGKPAGIAWKPPYEVEIGDLLVEGENTVEVRVANLWVNRLVGDAQPGAKKASLHGGADLHRECAAAAGGADRTRHAAGSHRARRTLTALEQGQRRR